MRAFIAIELPETLRGELAAVQDRLKGAGVDASWPRPGGIHLTLKFLGELTEAQVPGITKSLAPALAGMRRFPLGIEGIGTFPNPAAARVVWLGVNGDLGSLAALRSAVESAAAEAGFAHDGRPYTPHLTLGRIKRIQRRDRWLSALKAVANVRLPGFEVAAISLISSELKPSGAVYRELASVSLGS